ncbi:MAG: response regulator [Anaerolineaceae bacterium]|nr:response regulator [Anaerolineaceae bacterium]
MDFDNFENLVKDALSNMFDYAALENHPLIAAGIKPHAEFKGSRSDFLRSVLLECINSLKPVEIEYDLLSNEWRSFIILSQRYVENISSNELAKFLMLGDRQIRRSQKKAIRAVALILWDRLQTNVELNTEEFETNGFVINRETINLNQVIQSVLDLLKNHFEKEAVIVEFIDPKNIFSINSDRIILRQILIRILNLVIQKKDIHQIKIQLEEDHDDLNLIFFIPEYHEEIEKFLTNLHFQENMLIQWVNELNLKLEGNNISSGFNFLVHFANQEKKLILVVDDQEPALKMYERYLSRTKYKIYGLSKATKVLNKAIELKPALILLDIMMPKLDGWEILQSLRLNEKTRHIPIVVCSAWGEPELAESLGADYFLRKPIVQKELLEILEFILED